MTTKFSCWIFSLNKNDLLISKINLNEFLKTYILWGIIRLSFLIILEHYRGMRFPRRIVSVHWYKKEAG
jgi:hypothetical protein